MSRRFYDAQPFHVGTTASLGESASHHIGKVLRMRVGDSITLFNGEGGEYQATLSAIGKKTVDAAIVSFDAVDRCPPAAVTVALPFIKGERMDYAIQKATELGAHSFQLLVCERSDVRLDGDRLDKKLGHLRQVAVSACEQCGMNRVPEFTSLLSFSELVRDCNSELKLLAHPGEQRLQLAPDFRSTVTLVTGPEGGFSDNELQQAQRAGFASFALGERVLRAETAPVTLLAALWSLLDQ